MRVIQISKPEYSNETIKKEVDFVLETNEIDGVILNDADHKGMLIGGFLSHITDRELLKKTLYLLKNKGYFTHKKDFDNVTTQVNKKTKISESIAVRFEAICYGELLKKECYINRFPSPKNKYLPRITFEIGRDSVKTNLDEIIDEVNRNGQDAYLDEIQKLPKEIQVNKFKEVLSSIARIKYSNNTNELDNIKELYTELRDNISNTESCTRANFETKDNEFNRKENKKEYKKHVWFKVGLLYATIDMETLIEKFNRVPIKVAVHLGFPSYEKYILATMNNYKGNNSSKNIYHSKERMENIIQHCKENNMNVRNHFFNKLPPN